MTIAFSLPVSSSRAGLWPSSTFALDLQLIDLCILDRSFELDVAVLQRCNLITGLPQQLLEVDKHAAGLSLSTSHEILGAEGATSRLTLHYVVV